LRNTIKQWVKIAQELEKLNNWHSLCGVVGGLHKSLTPENRPFWDKVLDQSIQWFIATRQIFAQPLAQLAQHQLRLNPPCIPYLPIFNRLAKDFEEMAAAPLLSLSKMEEAGELLLFYQRYGFRPFFF
jgi:hypothetical protein